MISSLRVPKIVAVLLLGLIVFAGGTSGSGFQRLQPSRLRLPGHMPGQAIRAANWLGREAPDTSVSMAISLPLRNQAELGDLLSRIYDPADPLYGQYLSAEEFTDRFGPTQDDYDLVAAYARSLGLNTTGLHANRLLLDVSGPAQTVEAAFNLRMQRYQTQDGRDFHAPDDDPEVPDFIASRVVGVVGLDNAAVWHAHSRSRLAQEKSVVPLQIGTGPGGALAPDDISTAYNLNTIEAKGSGQVLGLFELDGYSATDIAAYEKYFGLPAVPLQNVLVDGYSGRAGSGASEVTLDIELMVAIAPNASQIIVYGTSPGSLNRTISDNSLSTAHALTISRLSRSTSYYYQVTSSAGGVTVSSAIRSFITQ